MAKNVPRKSVAMKLRGTSSEFSFILNISLQERILSVLLLSCQRSFSAAIQQFPPKGDPLRIDGIVFISPCNFLPRYLHLELIYAVMLYKNRVIPSASCMPLRDLSISFALTNSYTASAYLSINLKAVARLKCRSGFLLSVCDSD